MTGDITVFPNPATDHIVLKLPSSRIAGDVTLIMYSQHGKVVSRKSVWGDKETIPVSHLTPGLYYLGVASNNSISFHKVVIGLARFE